MIQLPSVMTRARFALLCVFAMSVAGCSTSEPAARTERPAPSDSSAPAPTPSTSASETPRIVILGDSLTAGLGIEKSQSFPSLLQERLDAEGLRYEVVNAGVSGDTTAGGLRRFEWATEGNVDVLVIALGGNDGLRGLPVAETRRNLAQIIERAQQRGIRVILAGMEAPPNYGEQYTSEFRQTFSDLAKQYNVTFVPFLLEGVAGVPALNTADGIHPNPEGARVVERNIWKALEPVLHERTR
jgi:acyl-CoA thioesterase-1